MTRKVGPVAEEVCSLTVRTPAELVLDIDRHLRTGAYEPGLLAETPLSLTPVGGKVDTLASGFVSTGHGERRRDLDRRLARLLKDPHTWQSQVVHLDERPVALVVWREGPDADDIAVLRVAPAWALASTVVRQLLYTRRSDRARRGGGGIRVTEPYVTRPVERALTAEAFVPSDDHRLCTVVPLLAPARDVAAWPGWVEEERSARGTVSKALGATNPPTAVGTAELERRFWPLKIADGGLPTYIVPIRPRWAEELVDSRLVAQTLFPRELRLGVAREHVYYRSPRSMGLRAPARLLWYVSAGRDPRPGVMAVRAISRLEEVIIDTPERLYQRFSHLGVYGRGDIERSAEGGRAMALRFADTEELPGPVTYDRLKELATLHRHRLVLYSASRIPPELFADVYREAFDGELRA